MVAWPRLGALPVRLGAGVLLGHQPRDDPPGLTRAGASPRRQLPLSDPVVRRLGSRPRPSRGRRLPDAALVVPGSCAATGWHRELAQSITADCLGAYIL